MHWESLAVAEFEAMAKALHEAGIEMILDVVYNHTAEGNHLGSRHSFETIDNPAYHRLDEGSRDRCAGMTGGAA